MAAVQFADSATGGRSNAWRAGVGSACPQPLRPRACARYPGVDSGRHRDAGVRSTSRLMEEGCVEQQPQLLLRTLVELADTSGADCDLVELLYLLTERCVAVCDATAAGVLLRDPTRGLELVAGSDREMRALARSEAELQEGPGWQAFATGEPVTVTDLSCEEQRWPRFAARAARLGLRSVHAEPVRLRERRIGGLDVFRAGGAPLSAEGRCVVARLAEMAAIGILHERARAEADEEIRRLRSALDNRAVVEQAKALLAERLAIDSGTAFDWLRRYARNHNHRLRDVAQRVLEGNVDAARIADERTP